MHANPDVDPELLYLDFNQDATCISVGTRAGFSLYTCSPFGQVFHQPEPAGVVELLERSSLVALVSAGGRGLRLWNTSTSEELGHLHFPNAILTVKLNRTRLVVACAHRVYVVDLNSLEVLDTLETGGGANNARGLCALSTNGGQEAPSVVAFPTGSGTSDVLIYDATNLSVVNVLRRVHRSELVALALSPAGTSLASASISGTVVRVWHLPTGELRVQTLKPHKPQHPKTPTPCKTLKP